MARLNLNPRARAIPNFDEQINVFLSAKQDEFLCVCENTMFRRATDRHSQAQGAERLASAWKKGPRIALLSNISLKKALTSNNSATRHCRGDKSIEFVVEVYFPTIENVRMSV